MKIKICGLTRKEDIAIVNKYKPDYIGFVFARSKRQVELSTAKELKGLLHKSIKTVGVFVDADLRLAIQIANEGILDLIQLHGAETEAYIRELKKQTNIGIIKAVRADELEDTRIDTAADYILLDSGAGSGKVFDWNRTIICNKPLFLAGGLDAENVSEAIRKVKPFAVDVSSGVETDCKKDSEKIRKFIEESRRIYE